VHKADVGVMPCEEVRQRHVEEADNPSRVGRGAVLERRPPPPSERTLVQKASGEVAVAIRRVTPLGREAQEGVEGVDVVLRRNQAGRAPRPRSELKPQMIRAYGRGGGGGGDVGDVDAGMKGGLEAEVEAFVLAPAAWPKGAERRWRRLRERTEQARRIRVRRALTGLVVILRREQSR